MIDTGSTRSLMNPSLAYGYYRNYIQNEEFSIRIAHNTTVHNEVVNIPIFNIFQVSEHHKFYLFKFGKRCDGLIGIDLLKQLKTSINLDRNLLITPRVTIPINYEPQELTALKAKLKTDPYIISVPPRTEKIVKIPVEIKEGIGILDYVQFANQIESPRAMVNIKDYFITTTVVNSSTEFASSEF